MTHHMIQDHHTAHIKSCRRTVTHKLMTFECFTSLHQYSFSIHFSLLFCKKYNIKRLGEYSNMAKKFKMSLISLQTPTCGECIREIQWGDI